MEIPFEQFHRQFQFCPQRAWHVGVEQEGFLYDQQSGTVVARSPEVTPLLYSDTRQQHFSAELSACQIELKTEPAELCGVKSQLIERRSVLENTVTQWGLRVSYQPVGPADMPLTVFPDPAGRYQAIAASISREDLIAGCRVAGVHGHIGMPDPATALRVYNYAAERVIDLIELGSGFESERMQLYRAMAPHWRPRQFADWQELYRYALQAGFAKNPRDWWSLIRITIYGTIEFRMFDSVEDVDQITDWMKDLLDICRSV